VVQFILASVIIGEGIFSGDREALEVAGPGGTLVALFLVGALAICVMSCVSELVQLFPVPNAIVEYIKAFVDEDLAWCCGIAYW
jgi:amino acid transporter